MNAVKVTCSTGKTVILREPRIEDQIKSSEAASVRLSENASKYSFAIAMNQEMAKLLLVKVNDKEVKGSDREDLESLFTYREFSEVSQIVGKLTGGSEEKAPGLEFINEKGKESSGDK